MLLVFVAALVGTGWTPTTVEGADIYWTQINGAFCSGDRTGSYSTFNAAANACSSSSSCAAVYNNGCVTSQTSYELCTTSAIWKASSSGSCLYRSPSSNSYVQLATGTCENVGLKTIQTSSGCQAASNALGLDSSIETETSSGFTTGCYNGGSSNGVWLNYKTGNNCGTCSGHSSCSSVTTVCICEKGDSSSSVVSSSFCDTGHDGRSNPCKSDGSDHCCDRECTHCGPKAYCEQYSPMKSHNGMCNPSHIGGVCKNYFSVCPSSAEGKMSLYSSAVVQWHN